MNLEIFVNKNKTLLSLYVEYIKVLFAINFEIFVNDNNIL